MYRARSAVAGALVLCSALAGCEVPPSVVHTSAEVDGYLLRKRYRSACVGLRAEDASVREYTATKLGELSHVSVATDCLCDALYDPDAHLANIPAALGLAELARDDLAACLAPALDDAEIRGTPRAQVVHALGATQAPAAFAAIAGLLDDPDPEVRARAAEALRASKDATEALIDTLETDPAASVRAAAAAALAGRRAESVVDALVRSARDDADGEVRAASLAAAFDTKAPKADDMVCKAMLDDPDERVRIAAIQKFHGAKKRSSLACLEARMKAEETSGAARQALLDAVKASPSDEAADMLCRHIHPWSKMYIKDKIAPDIDGHNIARAQNDRDWERSYECVEKALAMGGLSCYARNYLGKWMNDLGGKAATPWCPGMVKD